MEYENVIRRFVRMFRCDTARISFLNGTHFLILGWNERSVGEWCDQDGYLMDFGYVREKVVASGGSMKELVASAKRYGRSMDMKWSDYFREELGASGELVEALKAFEL